MRPKNLSHKPLIEAILELRWAPALSKDGGIDSDLRLFLGKFHDLLAEEYPVFEVLGNAAAPEQMLPNVAQYRFRQRADGWPLVQIGSGVLTLNDTSSYLWEDYGKRAERIVGLLFQYYPGKLIPTSIDLRYINALGVDFEKEDILRCLAEKFRIMVDFPKVLFEDDGVEPTPTVFALQTAFPAKSPPGTIHFRLAKGKANDKDAIIWETLVHSEGKELLSLPKEFPSWLNAAHALSEEWFFRLVDGELLKQFS